MIHPPPPTPKYRIFRPRSLSRRGLYPHPLLSRACRLMGDSRASFSRFKALEARVAQEWPVLAEAQVAALEKARPSVSEPQRLELSTPAYF